MVNFTSTTPLSVANMNKLQTDLQDLATRKYYYKSLMLTSDKTIAVAQKENLFTAETIVTTGKPLLVTASLTVSVPSNMWVLYCVIDNTEYEIIGGNNNSAESVCAQRIIPNISKGSHTITFKMQSKFSGVVTIYSYNTQTYTAVEI